MKIHQGNKLELQDRLRENMERALCSEGEINAMFEATPLERMMVSPYLENLGRDLSVLYTSVGAESARRFLLVLMGSLNLSIGDVDRMEKEKE